MRHHDLPAALLAFAAIVAVLPAWVHFVDAFAPGEPTHKLLAGLVIPAVVLLYMTSWVSPDLAGSVTGVLVLLLAALVMAPSWWAMTDMAVSVLDGHPLAETLIRLSLSVVVLAAVASAGYLRVRRATAR